MTTPDRRPPVPPALRTAAIIAACLLIVAAGIYLVVWLLVRLAPLTLAIVAALLMAALIAPVSNALRRLNAPSWLAALGGVLTLLLILGGTLAIVGERTMSQFSNLQDSLDKGLDRLRDWALNGPFPISQRQLDGLVDGLSKAGRNAAPDPASGASTAAQILGFALLALILLFFLLKDGETIWGWLLCLAPDRLQERIDIAAHAGWQTLVAYVRGTVAVALVDAVGIGLALVIIGVPLALPLSLLTFIAAFIPLLGATVAGALAVLVAFVSNGVTDALLVLLAVLIVQQAEGNLLQPLIMGRALKLHPAVVLITVTAGTLLAGIPGAVVAVPLTAVVYRVTASLRTTRPEKPTSLDGEPVQATTGQTTPP